MKKLAFFCLLSAFLFAGCDGAYKHNLKQMGKSVERNFVLSDINNNISTTLEEVRPISYIELTDQQKETPHDKYLGQFYIKGTWFYIGSSLIYNMNDTIQCYFDKNLKYLRRKKE